MVPPPRESLMPRATRESPYSSARIEAFVLDGMAIGDG
jgi:hypothetical protein